MGQHPAAGRAGAARVKSPLAFALVGAGRAGVPHRRRLASADDARRVAGAHFRGSDHRLLPGALAVRAPTDDGERGRRRVGAASRRRRPAARAAALRWSWDGHARRALLAAVRLARGGRAREAAVARPGPARAPDPAAHRVRRGPGAPPRRRRQLRRRLRLPHGLEDVTIPLGFIPGRQPGLFNAIRITARADGRQLYALAGSWEVAELTARTGISWLPLRNVDGVLLLRPGT
jgi:hypothetical protein